MKSGNPALSSKTFEGFGSYEDASNVMTVEGTATKTAMLLVLVVAAAAYTWNGAMAGQDVQSFMMGGGIVGFIFALMTIFKPTWSPVTAPLYAVAEGLFLGAFSAFAETYVAAQTDGQFQGITFQAACLTFGVLFSMLTVYRAGWVRATEKFKAGLMSAMGAVFFIYVLTFILSFFGTTIPFIHGNGMIGIGFSLVVIVIASLCLIMDFDFIEQGAAQGAPKYMEWYGAFGLLVTLVWLYIEIVRLLMKLNSRD